MDPSAALSDIGEVYILGHGFRARYMAVVTIHTRYMAVVTIHTRYMEVVTKNM